MDNLWRYLCADLKAAIATLALFSMVEHWNSWFDGLISDGGPGCYPLQSYIQTIVIQLNFGTMSREDLMHLALDLGRNAQSRHKYFSGLLCRSSLPIRSLQKYFVKGIVLGSVKGYVPFMNSYGGGSDVQAAGGRR